MGGQQVVCDRPVYRQSSAGRSRLISHLNDKKTKKTLSININIPESTYNSPSIGWSRILFGVSCDG